MPVRSSGKATITRVRRYEAVFTKTRWLLLNGFRAKKQYSSGIVEGFSTKAKLSTRKAYGFRARRATEVASYHALGALPVPKATHVFSNEAKMLRRLFRGVPVTR